MSSPSAVSPLARRVFLANLVAQVGIVITGGLVRLTGSGLGCDTWPRCNDTQWTPHEASSINTYIEFGNRMLTYVVGAIAVAAIVVAWRHRPVRKEIRYLAAFQLCAILGQAVLGGITVLTDLHPAAVASHMLLSMFMIASAVALYERSGEGYAPVRPLVRNEIRLFGAGTVAVLAALLVVGTVVTGSGPHAGDEKARRFDVNVDQMAWLHADLAFLLLGAAVALALALRVTDAPKDAQHRVWWLLGVLIPQGLIGYTQYFNGLPKWQVSLHMLGASLVVVTTTRILFGLRTRDEADAPAGEDAEVPAPAEEPVAATIY
ncbi:COX15/CtaA family protein [Yinghuangia seranimata]|uniref:COX15/CtaA family protein n=1 Tax=Yinghuangia seranimata TaxID=408067 RepID=UPI00248B0A55|nr:COX15/CtaA family protein [Yinghuangia seranimata]MDI2126316.1 COX15/CtaA family protein [Yinghuangia seranimata]